MKSMFEGRTLLIATKHSKERAIAPIMERDLGVLCGTTSDFDTDLLGTFTGEVERKDDPHTTARTKCRLALQSSGYDLGIASEGSFGPHPSNLFVPADEEVLVFIDLKYDLEISVREISTQTNFSGARIQTKEELLRFAIAAGFPSHGLILRKSKEDLVGMRKGIVDLKALESEADILLLKYGSAWVETDMRAVFNPMRMQVISRAAHRLSAKIRSHCPDCGCPGFGVTYIHSCLRCGHRKEEWYPHGKRVEDPMHCDNCNP
jgi:hypothetical protein